MSQDERRARRAGKVVLQLYREHDPPAQEIATRMSVSCKEGCAHCCQLPATATIPEMVPIVEYLTSRADWPRRRPALERELTHQLTAFVGVNVLVESERVAFFQRKLPCVFLTKDQRCEIYKVRPTVCRYHMVVSPPESCEGGEIAIVDMHAVENRIALGGAEAFGELTGGPIALAFVLAADMLGVKLTIDRDLIKRVTLVRIPMPRARARVGYARTLLDRT